MLCVVGDLREDIITVLESDPTRGASVPASIHLRRGGSAANVAAFVADAGKPVRCVGQVGTADAGQRILGGLEQRGVDLAVTAHGDTSRAVVLVGPDGVATALVDPGASAKLLEIPPEVLDGVSLLHLPADVFAVDPLATEVGELVGEALHREIPITLGAMSATALQAFGRDEFLELLATVRPAVLFANRSEAAALSGPRTAVPGADLTVVTSGPRPTVLAWPNGSSRSIEVDPVDLVLDTTGVGDAFIAGFLIATMDRLTAATATKAGHLLAGQVLGHYGADLVRRR